jgi:hypothetical protein
MGIDAQARRGCAYAKADACAIWVCQWVSQEIRVLDYLEGVGQVRGYYTNELRHRGYEKAFSASRRSMTDEAP